MNRRVRSARLKVAAAASFGVLLLIATLCGSDAHSAQAVFRVDGFGAAHSIATIVCSGAAGARVLRCNGGGDFKAGEGAMISTGGPASVVGPIQEAPTLSPIVKPGPHSYTYVVVAADLLHGMTSASPPAVVGHTLELDGNSRVGLKAGTAAGTLPVYLWYASEDGGPYRFVLADEHVTPSTPDAGQRPADGRGWPNSLPQLPRHEDLWTTIVAVHDDQIEIADALGQDVVRATVYHDDTEAAQRAVDAAVAAGGGVVEFGPYSYNLWRPAFWHGTAWTRSIKGAEIMYPPKLYVGGAGNITFAGAGPATRLINLPDASTFSAMVSFGTEHRRPWDLPYVAIRPITRGSTRVELAAPASSAAFHAGDDVWLFSGSFMLTPCLSTHGTPGGNCHFSELNSISKVDNRNGVLELRYPATNSYRDDGINPLGIVDVAGSSMHHVGFRDLTIDAWGPISSEALVQDFHFDHVNVPIGPTTNWWYGGVDRGWYVKDSTLNIGDGGMYYSVMNEMDQYSDVQFADDTFIGHSAPHGADKLIADSSIRLDEGSGDATFRDDHFVGVQLKIDNAFNGLTIERCRFENAGLHLGCNVEDGCGPQISSFGISKDVTIRGNGFTVQPPFAPSRLFEVRIPASNISVTDNSFDISGAENAELPAMYVASGEIRDNHIVSHRTGNTIGIEVFPEVIPGLPQPDVTVDGNQITHSGPGIGVEVRSPKKTYSGAVSIAHNNLRTKTPLSIDPAARNLVKITGSPTGD